MARCILFNPATPRYRAYLKSEEAGRMAWCDLRDDDITLCSVDVVQKSETLAIIYMDVWYKNDGEYFYDSLVDIKDGLLDLESIREYKR